MNPPQVHREEIDETFGCIDGRMRSVAAFDRTRSGFRDPHGW